MHHFSFDKILPLLAQVQNDFVCQSHELTKKECSCFTFPQRHLDGYPFYEGFRDNLRTCLDGTFVISGADAERRLVFIEHSQRHRTLASASTGRSAGQQKR